MSIYKDGDRFRVEVNSNHRRLRQRASTMEEAKLVEQQLRERLQSPHALPLHFSPSAKPNSIDAFVKVHGPKNIWTSRRRQQDGQMESNYQKYSKRYAEIMDDILGKPLLTEITTAKIADMVDALIEERDIVDSTVNRYLAVLHKMLDYAKATGIDITMPVFPWRDENGHRPRILQPEEQPKLLRHLRQQHEDSHDACLILLMTGARPSEIFKAEPAWLSDKWLKVPPAYSKTGKERQLPLTPQVNRLLGRWLPWQRLNLRCFRYDWNIARREMGLQEDPYFVPYILRHTFATRAIKAGVDVRVVQDLLGHNDINTTLRYTKVEPDQLTQAAAKINSMFGSV